MIRVVYHANALDKTEGKIFSSPRFFTELNEESAKTIERDRHNLELQLGNKYRVVASIETEELIKETK